MILNVLLWIMMIVMICTSGVLLVMTCIDFRREVRAARRVRRHLEPAVQAEIEQTMEWWDHEFRKGLAEVDRKDRLDQRLYQRRYHTHSKNGISWIVVQGSKCQTCGEWVK